MPDQFLPRWQLTAKLALRQFEQQRCERLGDALQIAKRQQPIPTADVDRPKRVQMLVTVAFRHVQMVPRVHDDVAGTASICMDAQGDLLRHRAAWHEHGGLGAEQRSDAGFEVFDHRAPAVLIGLAVVFNAVCDLEQRLLW